MPRPNYSAIQTDPFMTNISIAHTLDRDDLIHHRVFPVVPVKAKVGSYWQFNSAETMSTEAAPRSASGEAPIKEIGGTQAEYNCKEYALDGLLADAHRDEQDSPYDEATVITGIVDDVLLQREINFIDNYIDESASTTWSNTAQDGSGADFVQWDGGSATPIEDVANWKETIKIACGREPNVMVIAPNVWRVLKNDSSLVGRLADNKDKHVLRKFVADLFEVEEILVPGAVRNTAVEGATQSNSFVLSNKVLLAYRAKSPSRMTPSAGYVFSHRNDHVKGTAAAAPGIIRWREDRHESTRYRAKGFYDHKIVTASAGQISYNVLATP